MVDKEIIFIAVTYGNTTLSFEDLLVQMRQFSLVIVNNKSSTKPTRDIKFQENAINIKYIQAKNNFGYGGGVNLGVKYALEKGAEWVVVMNQDLKVTKKGVEALDKILQKNPPGIVGPFAGGLDPKRWTTMLPSDHVDYISGACMAIHRDVIEKVGYFYELYFMYYEDADYCVRAKKAGFPLIHASIAGIQHDDSPSLGKGSFLHEYYLARNHLLFVERLAPAWVKLYEYLRLPKTIAEFISSKNQGGLAGVGDYFLHRFGEKNV